MANYQLLKADIDAKVYENAQQKITGENLNAVLNAMVTTLGAGYQFAGVATPASNPGTPDAKVFYIANGKGTYTNFGGLDVTEDEVVILYLDSAWHKMSTGIALKSEIPDISDKADKATTLAGYGIGDAYTKSEVDDALEGKQDTITDLDAIRQGAQKGSTALQSESDPVYMADKPKLALKVEIPDVSGKVDKVAGKGLSSNDYTDADKLKLAGLENYDDTQVRALIAGKQDKLVPGDNITIVGNVISSTGGSVDLSAYAKKEEVNTALEDKQDKLVPGDNITIVGNVISSTGGGGGGGEGGSVDLSAYAKKEEVNTALAGKQDKLVAGDNITIVGNVISSTGGNVDLSAYAKKEEVNTALAGKQDTISDLESIREGAALGKTALQSYTETDPVYMADKPNLALKSEIPDISGKQDKISDLATIRSGAAKGATALQSYTETDPIYTADKPTIAFKRDIPDISGKADKAAIVTETEGNSSYSIAPNRLTRLGTLTSNVTLSLNTASEEAGVVNVYDIIFKTSATSAPSITWPEGITWVGGSAPAIAGGKTYEVSIMDRLATYGEFSI